jgi:hypothetical protein
MDTRPVRFLSNPFVDWRRFERELRRTLETRLDADAVEAVVERAHNAVARLQPVKVLASMLDPNEPERARRQARSKDFRSVERKALRVLIDSFIALERPTR